MLTETIAMLGHGPRHDRRQSFVVLPMPDACRLAYEHFGS